MFRKNSCQNKDTEQDRGYINSETIIAAIENTFSRERTQNRKRRVVS